MILTDTHTHLYVEQFDEDRAQVIKRAQEKGIERFFIPAIDASYYPAMLQLKNDFPDNVFLMAGLHPTHVKEDFMDELEVVKQMLAKHQFYAIGEIGIDLYWDKSFLKQQQDAFKWQIELAKTHHLPIVIHCREAFDEIFEVLEEVHSDDLFGIFHCFTGTKEQAIRAINFNMKLGIGGVATFKNCKIDRFLNQIPLEHIVLETDSPYLAPTPFRGKRNESSYLLNVANKLADIYDTKLETIAAVTTENSKQIFGI